MLPINMKIEEFSMTSVLSDTTRKIRRNLILVSFITFFLMDESIGIKSPFMDFATPVNAKEIAGIGLALIIIYLTVVFYRYCKEDKAKWKRVKEITLYSTVSNNLAMISQNYQNLGVIATPDEMQKRLEFTLHQRDLLANLEGEAYKARVADFNNVFQEQFEEYLNSLNTPLDELVRHIDDFNKAVVDLEYLDTIQLFNFTWIDKFIPYFLSSIAIIRIAYYYINNNYVWVGLDVFCSN